MSLNFEDCRVFYSAAKYKSLTRAAEALGISQPSATRAVKALEEELGTALLIRTRRGVELTGPGESLFRHAEPACRHLREGEDEVRDLLALREGTVRLGASETTLQHYLMPILAAFRREHPGVRLRVSNNPTPAAAAALREGLTEFAVVTSPVAEDPLLRVERLKTVRDIAVAGPWFSELKGRKLSWEELSEYPVVCLTEETTSRRFLEDAFSRAGLALRPDVELATMDLVVPMAARNMGVGFVSADFARAALESGEVFEVELQEPLPPRHICLVRREGVPLSPAGAALYGAIAAAGEGEKRRQ